MIVMIRFTDLDDEIEQEMVIDSARVIITTYQDEGCTMYAMRIDDSPSFNISATDYTNIKNILQDTVDIA